jgi:hypothetical protein
MKASLSLLLAGVLLLSATSLALGSSRKSENSANHAGTSHRSRGTTHHRGTHHNSTNSGSKKTGNVPSS